MRNPVLYDTCDLRIKYKAPVCYTSKKIDKAVTDFVLLPKKKNLFFEGY